MSKKSSLSSSGDLGFFGELWQQAKLVFQLTMDRDVPIYLKLLPVAAVAYLLFPVDILPDMIPGLGQIDDITLLLIGAKVFIDLAPQDVVAKYLGRSKESGEVEPTADKSVKDAQDEGDIIEGIIIEDDDVK